MNHDQATYSAGCRCDDCREARRRSRRELATAMSFGLSEEEYKLRFPGRTHGIMATAAHGCKCRLCKDEANRLRALERKRISDAVRARREAGTEPVPPRRPSELAHLNPPTEPVEQLDLDPFSDNWQTHGACVGLDPALFFPDRGGPTEEARAVCTGLCPVRDVCLEWALENDERFGVWGGTSERQRRLMRPDREHRCGTWKKAHAGCNCPPCRAAWERRVEQNAWLRSTRARTEGTA